MYYELQVTLGMLRTQEMLYKLKLGRLHYSVESIRKDTRSRNTLSVPERGLIGELNLLLFALNNFWKYRSWNCIK